MLPRGLRNNNPGNISKTKRVWRGEVAGTDERFETFATMLDGLTALCNLLLEYQRIHGLNTIAGIIDRWAPPSENNTAAYIEYAARNLGVQRDTPIDVSDPKVIKELTLAISRYENGQREFDTMVPMILVDQAVAQALNMRVEDVSIYSTGPLSQPTEPTHPESTMTDTILEMAPAIATVFGGPAAGLLAGLAGSIIKGFAPLAQEKVQKIAARHTDNPETAKAISDALTGGVIQIAQELTKKSDPIEATMAAKSDPVIMQQIEDRTVQRLDDLLPALDRMANLEKQMYQRAEDSMNNAVARQSTSPEMRKLAYQMGQATAVGMVLIAAFLLALCGLQLYTTGSIDGTVATLTGTALGVIYQNAGQIFNFLFGTSPNSPTASSIKEELIARRPK